MKTTERIVVSVVLSIFALKISAYESLFVSKEHVKVAWDQTNRLHVGNNFVTNTTIAGTAIACRERSKDGETHLQGVTFLKFDFDQITPALVNAPGFTATLQVRYDKRLNTQYNLAVGLGVVPQQHTWTNAPGAYPLATWVGAADLNAAPGLLVDVDHTLVANVRTQAPTDIFVTVTEDVQAWVAGGITNNGYAVFGTTDSDQGAAFHKMRLIFSGAPLLTDHWGFDEIGGSVAVNSADGTNGVISGGVTLNQAGKIGRAYAFDGTDGVVKATGYKGINGTMARTVSMWIKTTGGSGAKGLISWGENALGAAWDFVLDGQRPRLNINGGFQLIETNVTDGVWHHLAAVFPGDDSTPNSADVKVYVDGEEGAATSTSSTELQTAAILDVFIGLDRFRGSNYFSGLIDDVAIWKAGLDAGEIRSLYQLADAPRINYSAADVQRLWNLYYAGEGQIQVGSRTWKYRDNLSGATADGQLLDMGAGTYHLVMNASEGLGLVTVLRGTVILVQ